jgi:hypothetical protein
MFFLITCAARGNGRDRATAGGAWEGHRRQPGAFGERKRCALCAGGGGRARGGDGGSAPHLEDLVLLQRLARDVERQVLRVDDALDEGEPLGDQVLAVVHDEDAADVELNVAAVLLLGLVEVKGRALGHEEDRGELERALDGEVLDGEVVLPVVGERLVEGAVLLAGHVLGLARPDGLLLVHDGPLVRDLLDGLGLLLLLGLVLLDLLDLRLVVVVALLLLLVLVVVVVDLLVDGLLGPERDRVVDELRVLLDEVLEPAREDAEREGAGAEAGRLSKGRARE